MRSSLVVACEQAAAAVRHVQHNGREVLGTTRPEESCGQHWAQGYPCLVETMGMSCA